MATQDPLHRTTPNRYEDLNNMQWIAPFERDATNNLLEKRLWGAADQLRANSGLTAAQYSQPVLGLIFLRFADARFEKIRLLLEHRTPTPLRATRLADPNAYQAEGVLYLEPKARFQHLLNLPEGAAVGQALNDAMRVIERDNPQLSGVLPKTYEIFESRVLVELLKLVSSVPTGSEGDIFGKVYEYFLATFAMAEGQLGGEFYTPTTLVRLLVEVIEPFHGRILDPACGSGGMFVQSARFVEEHRKNPSEELSIHGQERVDATARLARLNLAIHGLEGEIRQGNTYYEDLHQGLGKFDFVLANPPFNVDAVDKERLVTEVGPGRRFPFGLPRADNANYLWIQIFYSALNESGRAGFVMANSAADARTELEIRKELIESGSVDVVVAVGSNMFYTVTLPCTLWFLDKGRKGTPRENSILFIDARSIYRQVDRALRDWTAVQICYLANIVRLYRGEQPDFTLGGTEAKAKLSETMGADLSYCDVPGLCKSATLADIAAKEWSLSPSRYVGVISGEAVNDEDFKDQLELFNEELEALNSQAHGLHQIIARSIAEILTA
jgi:type I restriction enzyme M protein